MSWKSLLQAWKLLDFLGTQLLLKFESMDTRIAKMNFIATLPSHNPIELLHKVNTMWRSLFHLPSG
jgi:hypothetical protein